jgi:hypothetical protein
VNSRRKFTKASRRCIVGYESRPTRDALAFSSRTRARMAGLFQVPSSRTALRDSELLIAAGVVERKEAGGRSTSYGLKGTAKIREQDWQRVGKFGCERDFPCPFCKSTIPKVGNIAMLQRAKGLTNFQPVANGRFHFSRPLTQPSAF